MLLMNVFLDFMCTVSACINNTSATQQSLQSQTGNLSIFPIRNASASNLSSIKIDVPPTPVTLGDLGFVDSGFDHGQRQGVRMGRSDRGAPDPEIFSLSSVPTSIDMIFQRNSRQARQLSSDSRKLVNAIHSISQSYFKLDSQSGRPLVKTREGWVEGYYQTTILGRQIAAYEGIRYAKPPTGNRRFSAPQPADPWKGIRVAWKRPPYCLQMDFTKGFRIHGSEDCLFLSVYSPIVDIEEPKSKTNLPVVVFIHGGGYSCGWSGFQGASYILNKNVVFVTMNYRVGVLGFLSTGDAVAPGNWALKDQTLALKWVAHNIKFFGGDPSRVTIMGESAGAASVGLHLVSPLSAGLFHRAICNSGSGLGHWALVNDTIQHSATVAQSVDCPTHDSFQMIRCLRTKDPYWIVGRMLRLYKYLMITRIPFGPVIELDGPSSFLPLAPEVAYANGQVNKVPLIIGFNQDEGAAFSAVIYLLPLMMARLNRNWDDMATFSLTLDNNRTDNAVEVAQKIRKFYIQEEGLSYANKKKWMQVFGDRTIVQGVHKGMQFHSQVAPTFGYVFNYQGSVSILDAAGLNWKDWGVSHGDDLPYLFNSTTAYKSLKVGTQDFEMSQFLLDIIAHFAATGKPLSASPLHSSESGDEFSVSNWEPISSPYELKLLSINKDVEMTSMPFMNRMTFWEDLALREDPVFPKPQTTSVPLSSSPL